MGRSEVFGECPMAVTFRPYIVGGLTLNWTWLHVVELNINLMDL